MKSGHIVINALDTQARRHWRVSSIQVTPSLHSLWRSNRSAWRQPLGCRSRGMGATRGRARSDAVLLEQRNSPHSLGLCCGGTIKAANGVGVMIGDAYDEQGRYHAFVWSASNGQRPVGPLDHYSSAVAIDAAGHILLHVGREAYLEEAGKLRRLDLAAKFYNSVRSMNDCDVVVGGYGPDSDHYRAFIWTATAGFLDLESLVPEDSGLGARVRRGRQRPRRRS